MNSKLLWIAGLLLVVSSIAVAIDSFPPGTNVTGAATFRTPSDPNMILSAEERPEKAFIRKLFIAGQGAAIAELDKTDILKMRIVGGQADLPSGIIVGHGLIFLNQEKFRLIHVTVDDQKTVRADIVRVTDENEDSPNYVGAIQLSPSTRNNRDLWTGTLTFNQKKYHVFLFAFKRSFKVSEIGFRIGLYCKDHPADAQCNAVSGVDCSGQLNTCRQRISEFCVSHASDARCTSLLTKQCTDNSNNDYRCQELQRVGAGPIAANR